MHVCGHTVHLRRVLKHAVCLFVVHSLRAVRPYAQHVAANSGLRRFFQEISCAQCGATHRLKNMQAHSKCRRGRKDDTVA